MLVVAALTGGVFGSWLGARRFQPIALKRALALVMVIASTKLLAAAFSSCPFAGPVVPGHDRDWSALASGGGRC